MNKKLTQTIKLTTFILFINVLNIQGQCAKPENIYKFNYNGKSYELVKENKSWTEAVNCAVEKGGYLAEINNIEEQKAIFAALNSKIAISLNNTRAEDGGNGAYFWLGANDLANEGNWIWDGNNDKKGMQFWKGTSSGTVVNNLYNNWGNEPDDFYGQDALAFSLDGWPLGNAGQWNDIDENNRIYFLIEYPESLGINDDLKTNKKINIFPNPASNYIKIKGLKETTFYQIYSTSGKEIMSGKVLNKSIDIKKLSVGSYILKLNNKKTLKFSKN